jgi:glutaredoxin
MVWLLIRLLQQTDLQRKFVMKHAVVSLSLAAAAAITVATLASAQSVFRWTDANGRVQYSDQPPPPDAKGVVEKNVQGSSIQNNEDSLASTDAQKKNPVILYTSECGDTCDAAKGYLNKRGIPHTIVDPTKSSELNQKFKDDTGGNTVPVLKVGERRLSGWSESNWSSALDSAGYPKTPPFSKPKPVVDRAGLDAKKPATDADKAKQAAPKANG